MRRMVIAATLLSLTAASVGQADSLWERRDPRYAFLFKDNRARSVGDTLVVLISETTVANEQDQRTLNRTTSSSGSVTFFDPLRTAAGSTGGGGGGAASTQLQFPSQNTAMSFSGSAATTVNHVFTDRLAVTVVDIMPNGNLVVEGYRSRVVQGEERVLRITGIVRQQDIAVGNVIPSGNVASFRISYLGRGPATRTTKQGIVTRLVSVFRLF